jgi:murein tripeptide amidase MpaA
MQGINIPMVMIGKNEENKPVLLITGRIHPGESNSSIILSNLMKYLCHSPEAKFLREK